jgi:hypothetical protein
MKPMDAYKMQILPPGWSLDFSLTRPYFNPLGSVCVSSAGRDARLYGRRDACRHGDAPRFCNSSFPGVPASRSGFEIWMLEFPWILDFEI